MLVVKTRLEYSSIHGLGCFAAEDITAGQLVWRFDPGIDLVFADKDLAALPAAFREFLKVYAYSPVAGAERSYVLCVDHARHMNHSDAPSLRETPEGTNVAARDIRKGEELTCNYTEFDRDAGAKLKGD
jgi:SET domain-containing protein